LHGANRLGGNSLSDLLVFGRRAGLAAAQSAKKVRQATIDQTQVDEAEREMLAPFQNGNGESPYAIHRDLQDTMQKLVGIFRNEGDLQQALQELEKLMERARHMHVDGSRMFNPGWHLSFDLKSMLTISEAVTRSALARRESRGAHSRIDYPSLDATWGKQNNVIASQDGAMMLRQEPVPAMPEELQKLLADEAEAVAGKGK
jgi:succinate dehydrogenase / fumarate reductase flavoprotein subunit